MTEPIDAARAILREACGDRVRDDVPMAPLTTFRIGGPAAVFLEPERIEDLHAVARAVARTGVAVAIVGKGSNVLVADEGFPGIVLRLGRGFRWSARDGETVAAVARCRSRRWPVSPSSTVSRASGSAWRSRRAWAARSG